MKGFRFNVGEKAKLDNFEVVVIARIEEDGNLFYDVKPAEFESITRCVAEKRLERMEQDDKQNS